MGFPTISFWCLAVEGGANLISRNSRFGGFNSRLGQLRELARSGLICVTVFAAEQR
jgi:hypothetical protein